MAPRPASHKDARRLTANAQDALDSVHREKRRVALRDPGADRFRENAASGGAPANSFDQLSIRNPTS
jgi:hypothetical protein